MGGSAPRSVDGCILPTHLWAGGDMAVARVKGIEHCRRASECILIAGLLQNWWHDIPWRVSRATNVLPLERGALWGASPPGLGSMAGGKREYAGAAATAVLYIGRRKRVENCLQGYHHGWL